MRYSVRRAVAAYLFRPVPAHIPDLGHCGTCWYFEGQPVCPTADTQRLCDLASRTLCCVGRFSAPSLSSTTPTCAPWALLAGGAARTGSLRSWPSLPSRKRSTAWSFSPAPALRRAWGRSTGLRPSPLGTATRAGMQLSHVAQLLAGHHHRPAPTDRKAVRRGPVAGRFSKPACPPPWAGSAGFAPNELFCRLSQSSKLAAKNSLAPRPSCRLDWGCRPHTTGSRTPVAKLLARVRARCCGPPA